MPESDDHKAPRCMRKRIWMPAAFMAFAIIVSVATPGDDVSPTAPVEPASAPTATSGPEYFGAEFGCTHGYNVIGDREYLSRDQQLVKLQEVRSDTKYAEPVIATPAAEMVRARHAYDSYGWDQSGADFINACADIGYLSRKAE